MRDHGERPQAAPADVERRRWTVVRTAEKAAPPVDADPFGPITEPSRFRVVPGTEIEKGRSGDLLRRLGTRYTKKVPLEPLDRRAVIASLFHEGSRRKPFLRRFATLMSLSVAIAVLGLVSDSTAVVIGAMLVAPLMAPVLAASAAIDMGWPARVRSNLAIVALGSIGAVALAALIGVFARSELDPLPSEILARTAPNLLDLGIAAAAGAAGAYAYVRKQASDALAGAAVAVALIPPLSVIGLMLQIGEFRLAGGATVLFLVNVAGVLVSGAVMFLVAGLVPGQRLLSSGSRIQSGLRWAAIGTIIVALPLQFGHQRLLPSPVDSADVENAVDNWAEDTGEPVETVDIGVDVVDGEAEVDIVIATPEHEPSIEDLVDVVAEEVGQPVTVDIQVVETDRSLRNIQDAPDDASEGDPDDAAENEGDGDK